MGPVYQKCGGRGIGIGIGMGETRSADSETLIGQQIEKILVIQIL